MTDPPFAVLSVDFELFSHTPAYRQARGTLKDDSVGLEGGKYLQDLLDRHDSRTTWFVVSSIAEEYPEVVESLAGSHEIGSHTRSHRLLTQLDSTQRREEIEQSRETLEATTGRDVTGFRVPAFDFEPDLFEMLADAGYEYDSSVVASRTIPGWYGGEYDLHRPALASNVIQDAPAEMWELPVSVMPALRFPLTGTWLRFFGPRYTILGMKWLARNGIAPMLYVHPWECVDLPTVDGVPKRVYYHTGAWMRRAIERILETDFSFVSARRVLQDSNRTVRQPSVGED